MERQKFEESFREAFQKAEVSPSENVWTNIELDMERLESGKMKKRIFFYKLVAAASVAFAMAIGGTGYFMLSGEESNSDRIALNENETHSSLESSSQLSQKVDESDLNASDEDQSLNVGGDVTIEDDQDRTKTSKEPQANSLAAVGLNDGNDARKSADATVVVNRGVVVSSSEEPVANPLDNSSTTFAEREVKTINRKLPALVRKRKFELYFPKTEPDEFDLMLAREEWKEKRDKKSGYEKVWTSVGFSAGSFNSGSSGTGGVGTLNIANSGLANVNYSAANTVSNEAKASGVAYSVGVNVGTRLSKRWILQGGLNYLTQNSNYTSDALVTTDYQNYSVANSTELTKLADGSSNARIVNTSPYNVNNSLQFLSLPIQAGYVVLNHAFAIQINGGVSTDLFLQNTITPENGSLDKVSTGPGEDSPYRPVNFSGLMGTEFSYRFADRYRLALTPGIRYPFSSIYKTETGLQANPITFDVGLRFRYIFQ